MHSRPPAPQFEFARREGGSGTRLCLQCGVANPLTNSFCSACGSPLGRPSEQPHRPGPLVGAPVLGIAAGAHADTVVCARCKGESPADVAFCQFCGSRLRGADRSPATESAGGPPAEPRPAPAPASAPAVAAELVVIGQDGTAGRSYPLGEEQTDIGREQGQVLLPTDPYVSPRHARLTCRGGRFFVRDLDSVNGVYVRLTGPHRLEHADLVLIGLEVLRFEIVSDAEQGLGVATQQGTRLFGSPVAPRYARLTQHTVEGAPRDAFYIGRDQTIIGRESGDIVFTTDPFMSRQHAAIRRDASDGSFGLHDLGSSNGTYVRIRGERQLSGGDHIRIGQHLFRLEVEDDGRN